MATDEETCLAAFSPMAVPVGRIFHLDQIRGAHHVLETGTAGAKIVVLTSGL
jgi:hypothetical protein